MSPAGVLLCILTAAALYTDLTKQLIPNKLTLPMVGAGMICHAAEKGWEGLKFSLLGIAAGFIPMLCIHLLGAVGAGDVKLFAAIGALTGLQQVWAAIMYSIIYAGIIGLVVLMIRKGNRRGESLRFPFMYAVVPGLLTAWYLT
jgi:prepilin peptidase CpaA